MGEYTTRGSEEARRISDQEMAQHEGLVRWVVRRQYRGALSMQDALHAGREGLWAALRGFDSQRGTAFSSYAVPAIAHAVWRAVAEEEGYGGSCAPGALPVTRSDEEEPWGCPTVYAVLGEMVRQLPVRLRGIILGHYGLQGGAGQSFATLGRTMGVSRQRAHQLHQEALLWLAHPAHSLALRRLLGRNTRRDYQATLARQQQRARQRRRGQGGRR